MKIETFYRDTKQLGSGEYRFRKQRSGAYTRAPSLSGLYSPRNSHGKTMRSMEFVITWVRKKAKHGFVHYICDKLKQGRPIRFLATGKVDTVYVYANTQLSNSGS